MIQETMKMTIPSRRAVHEHGQRLRGFTLTELLVVIAIIALLVAILLPALGIVASKARETETLSTMEEFAKACDAFHHEFGYYPGLVPEPILANDPQISGTENALLHLAGGAVREIDLTTDEYDALSSSAGWEELVFNGPNGNFRIKVNINQIGNGPFIKGRQYQPFYSPKESDLTPVRMTDAGTDVDNLRIPDIVDAWGMPVIYARTMRDTGLLVGMLDDAPQFTRSCFYPYFDVPELGESGDDQSDSILVTSGDPDSTFAQIIRHAAFGEVDQPLIGTPRGRYVLISAGPDRTFFSRFDGPGDVGSPIDNIVTHPEFGTPKVVEEYDDLRVFGGG